MSAITDDLTQMANALKSFGQDPNIYSVTLEHGREYDTAPLPPDVTRGPAKQCFQNAINIADDDELVYTEGYVLRPGVPMLIHHAWCVTPDGTVVDPTLDRPEECAYYGIEFQLHWILDLGYTGLALERFTINTIKGEL